MGTIKQAKIIRKASATETLAAMQKGQSIIIPFKEIRESSIRAAVSRLTNQKGYGFSSTVKTDRVEVIRIK